MNKTTDKNYQKFREQISDEKWKTFLHIENSNYTNEEFEEIIKRYFDVLQKFLFFRKQQIKVICFCIKEYRFTNEKVEKFAIYTQNPYQIDFLLSKDYPYVCIIDAGNINKLCKKIPDDKAAIDIFKRYLDKKYIIFNPKSTNITIGGKEIEIKPFDKVTNIKYTNSIDFLSD